MEHRWSKRYTVAMEVKLYHGGGDTTRAVARNISNHGVFVELPAAEATVNSVVDVELNLCCLKTRSVHRLPALVRHVSAHGLGLMFIDTDYELIRCFQDALHATRSGGALKQAAGAEHG